MTNSEAATGGATSGAPHQHQVRPNLSWRIIDIVTAAVLGVAVGFIFVVWNIIGGAAFNAIDAFTPGLGGLVAGVWFLGEPSGRLHHPQARSCSLCGSPSGQRFCPRR